MDYKTKAYYREKIKEISKRTKISELYITKKALELAKSSANDVGVGALSDPGKRKPIKYKQTHK